MCLTVPVSGGVLSGVIRNSLACRWRVKFIIAVPVSKGVLGVVCSEGTVAAMNPVLSPFTASVV
jgi:hypothetical protein